jgi:EAL and modified HD-GYP domain-containing signal transduction protein
MNTSNFIIREPLLDPQLRIVGYHLAWQRNAPQASTDAELEAFLGLLAGALNDADQGWLLGNKVLFLDAVPALLSTDALHAMPPFHTVLCLPADDLDNPDTRAAVRALRAGGIGISLHGAATLSQAALDCASHVEVRFSGADVAAQARAYAALKQASVQIVGRALLTWADFDACAALGLNVFAGKLHLTPRPGNKAAGMNPAQAIIVQLMQMVGQDADIAKIEGVLKRDAVLSYKLLRFINSAGMGHGREIASLRQALGLLGHAPLQRWLTLLLVTAGNNHAPVLMETAVVRGRLTELLGQAALGKSAADDLFVAGMFSLLDRLLGLPMAQVLDKVGMPDDVVAALLDRSGIYGPYLALAEACELDANLAGALAGALKISARDVNLAHLSALAWAQSIGV